MSTDMPDLTPVPEAAEGCDFDALFQRVNRAHEFRTKQLNQISSDRLGDSQLVITSKAALLVQQLTAKALLGEDETETEGFQT